MRIGWIIALCLLGGAVQAQDRLPDLQSCMNTEIARYERALARLSPAKGFTIGSVRGVDHCGTLGIVRCDRGADVLACQHQLAADLDALSTAIRATLPMPETVQGLRAEWSDTLYPLVHALAYGLSAGPDCEGDLPPIEAWCVARNATHRLSAAALAWQLARYLDATPTATQSGWAQPPAPTRPVPRPADGSP